VIVLDASALLAWLFGETGRDAVEAALGHARISTVNLCEVITRVQRGGHRPGPVMARLRRTGITIVEFDERLAVVTASLEPQTRAFGLSLGDRACLALAKSLDLPAMTADRAWLGVDVGVRLVAIR
jgi:PIN domain nuclease of toxin-antitoxin system